MPFPRLTDRQKQSFEAIVALHSEFDEDAHDGFGLGPYEESCPSGERGVYFGGFANQLKCGFGKMVG